MAFKSKYFLFRSLTDEEVEDFRLDAREKFKPGKDDIKAMWHPVYQEECLKMVMEMTRDD